MYVGFSQRGEVPRLPFGVKEFMSLEGFRFSCSAFRVQLPCKTHGICAGVVGGGGGGGCLYLRHCFYVLYRILAPLPGCLGGDTAGSTRRARDPA